MKHDDVILWIFCSLQKNRKNLSKKICYLKVSYAERFFLLCSFAIVRVQLHRMCEFPYMWVTSHWKTKTKIGNILSSRLPGVERNVFLFYCFGSTQLPTWIYLPWTDCYTIGQVSDRNKANYLKISDREYYVTLGHRDWVYPMFMYSVTGLWSLKRWKVFKRRGARLNLSKGIHYL